MTASAFQKQNPNHRKEIREAMHSNICDVHPIIE